MTRSLPLLVAGVIILATLISGCGGGSSDTPGVTLTIGADVEYATRAHSRAPIITAKLDAGGTVTVYNFETGAVITSGVLDSSGTCDLDVTPGLTVAVVVEGTREGKTYRFSTIIPVTPSVDTEYILDPVSSMAAEAIAQQYYAQNKAIDQGTFDDVAEQAAIYYADHLGADYSTSDGTLIGGTEFGAADSLDETELADVIAAVPDTIDDNLVAGKNAVQQIKDAGSPIAALVSAESLDIEGVISNEVLDSYADLGSRLDELILPLIFGDVELDGERTSIHDLTSGQNYTVASKVGSHVVLEDAGTGTAGQVRITYETGGETYTVVRRTSGSNYEITQTFSGDPHQEYKVTTPTTPPSGEDPSVTISVSLEDEVFTTAVIFVGTASATGEDEEHYTRVAFNGTLTTPEITSTMTCQADFPSSLPAGANPDDSIYEYPTRMILSNGRITLVGDDATITIAGSCTVTTQVLSGGDYAWIMPKTIDFNGSYTNSDTGMDFSGSIEADLTWEVVGDHENVSSGTLSMQGELSRTGYASYNADIDVTKTGDDATATISLAAGASTLDGTGTVTIDPETGPTSFSLSLTNQDGIDFGLAMNEADVVSGSIVVGDTTVATITKETDAGQDYLKITYTDDTFETLYF